MNLSDILDKIEPYLTQEELALIGQMEIDLEESVKAIGELESKILRLEEDVDTLEDEVRELEPYKENAEKVQLFADPSNWNGNVFKPVLNYLATDSPWELCE